METDNLVIKITADNGSAISGIQDVIEKLTDLDNAIGKDGQKNLSALSESLKGLAPAIKALSGAKTETIGNMFHTITDVDGDKASENISKVTDSLAKMSDTLSGLKGGAKGIANVAGALTILPDAMRGFGDANNYTNRIKEIKETLDGLAGASSGASKYGTGILNLATGIRKLPDALQGMKDLDMGTMRGAVDNLKAFSGAVSKALSQMTDVPTTGFSNLAQGMKDLSKAGGDPALATNLVNTADAVAKFSERLSTSVSDDTLKRLTQLGTAVKDIADAYRGLNSKVSDVSKKTGFGQGFDVRKAASQLSTFTMGFSHALEETGIKRYFDSLVNGIGKVSPMLGTFFNEARATFSGIAKVVTSNEPPVRKAIDLVSELAISRARRIVTIAGAPFARVANRINEISASLKTLHSRISRIILVRAIRSAITQVINGLKTGVSNLYQWATIVNNSFAPAMNSLASSAQYFKNSVGAMVSPIIESLAPAIELIVDECVRAINAINQLFSALSGATTWRKAVKQQVSFGKALGSSAGAAKELKKTLLGFDELNVLNDNSKGGGGGGASTPDYGGMFEVENVESKWKELANTSDWSKLGEGIANGLNNWEKSINWDRINEVAETWSTRIYTAFNGFVKARDWESFGHTIAQGINTGVHFIDDIAQNSNWTAFAVGLTRSLNTAVKEADWSAIGRTMTDGFKISAEMLHGFAITFDWVEFRNGLTEGIKSAFNNVNWGQLIFDVVDVSAELATTLADCINSIPWNKIKDALDQAPWDKLASALMDLLAAGFRGLEESGLLPIVGVALGLKLSSLFGALPGSSSFNSAINPGVMILGTYLVTQIFGNVTEGKGEVSPSATPKEGEHSADYTIIPGQGKLATEQIGTDYGNVFENVATGIGTVIGGIFGHPFVGAGLGKGVGMIGNAAYSAFNPTEYDRWANKEWAKANKGRNLPDQMYTREEAVNMAKANAQLEARGKLIQIIDAKEDKFHSSANKRIKTTYTAITDGMQKTTTSGVWGNFENTVERTIRSVNNTISKNNVGYGMASKFVTATKKVNESILSQKEVLDRQYKSGAISFKEYADKLQKIQKEEIMDQFRNGSITIEQYLRKMSDASDTNYGTIAANARSMSTSVSDALEGVKSSTSATAETTKSKLDEMATKYTDTATKATSSASVQSSALSGVKSATATVVDTMKKKMDELKAKQNEVGANASKNATNMNTAWGNIQSKTSSAINAIKSYANGLPPHLRAKFDEIFKMTFKFPPPIVPEFSIEGDFDYVKKTAPKVRTKFTKMNYAKAMDSGRILENATIFGAMNGNLLQAGEAGPEVVVGSRSLSRMINDTVQKAVGVVNNGGGNLVDNIVNAVTATVGVADGGTRTTELNLYLDNELIYQASLAGEEKYNQRYHIVQGVN